MIKSDLASIKAWFPWMRRALQLAELADGQTSPNPIVGAVVLDKDGDLVGEGFHSRAGLAHAELGALTQANEKANGGTLIVTLEPCCHQGRTPPCTEAVIEAGIRKVIVGMKDPDPRVSGAGISRLKDAGLEVISGVLEEKVYYQNRSFVHRIRTGRPWGILKWAMSLDGRTALTNGESKWISGQLARNWVHNQRARCDAVIIGGGTLRLDDPLLTTRGLRHPEPLRVVFTRTFNLPSQARLWDTTLASTLIAHGPEVEESKLQKSPDGLEKLCLDSSQPINLLEALAKRDCNRVIWECGPTLAASALKQDCVQELAVTISPKLLGGIPQRTPLGELGFTRIEKCIVLDEGIQTKIGEDFLFRASL